MRRDDEGGGGGRWRHAPAAQHRADRPERAAPMARRAAAALKSVVRLLRAEESAAVRPRSERVRLVGVGLVWRVWLRRAEMVGFSAGR